MNLPGSLLDEFAKVTHDQQAKKESTLFYGTARFTSDGDFVMIDGATTPTPASYATSAVEGDRVMGTIKNHKAIITANITNPSMTLGILRAISGIIVEGYLTTNAERTRYDDQTRTGLTFSNGGMGAYGGQGKYWYITNTGDFRAEQAYVKGTISASSGFIGSETSGFKIDEYGIYSGATKTGTSSGFITLGNADFTRAIGGTDRTLRFAIGSNFGVTATGVLYASNIDITGKITATSGKIGNFDINGALYSNNKSTLSSNVAGVYLGTDGIALGQDGKFKVTSAGVLTATGATITGTLTAGANSKIGPWTVSATSIYKGNNNYNNASSLYFGDSGLSIKQNFLVNSNGELTAKKGTIGGWSIETGYLGKITADGNYRTLIQAPASAADTNYAIRVDYKNSSTNEWENRFAVSYGGAIVATRGYIGGWTIGSAASNEKNGSLYYGTFGSNGSIYLIPKGTTTSKTIGGQARSDWTLTCGSKFGISKDGDVYGSSGKFGPLFIKSDKIYTGTENGNGIEISYGALKTSYSSYYFKAKDGSYFAELAPNFFHVGKDGGSPSVSFNSDVVDVLEVDCSLYALKNILCYSAIKASSTITTDSAMGTGGKTAWNDTGHNGVWLTTNGEIHLTRTPSSGNSGGYIGFHYARSANSTSSISETASGVITVSGKLIGKSVNAYSGNVVVSNTEANKRVSHLAGNVNDRLYVNAQMGVSNYANYYVAVSSSDVRLKENIADCEIDALPLVKSIRMRSFDWKDNHEFKHQPIGVIADEIEKLDPRLAYGGGYEEDGSMIVKSVDTFYLMGYLVKAVQELSEEVDRLKRVGN